MSDDDCGRIYRPDAVKIGFTTGPAPTDKEKLKELLKGFGVKYEEDSPHVWNKKDQPNSIKCMESFKKSLLGYEAKGKTQEQWEEEVMNFIRKKETERVKRILSPPPSKKILTLTNKKQSSKGTITVIGKQENQHCQKYICRGCNKLGVLETSGGSMIPINKKKVKKSKVKNSNMVISYYNWDFVVCKGCLKNILKKRKKKLDK